jgi:hypothetical protein
MGLRDVLIGIQNGPRGAHQPSSGGGMSPLVLALLGLLAYKAFKGRGGQTPAAPDQGAARGGTTGAPGGGLGDILGGLFGGRSGGGPAQPGRSLNDLLRGGLGGLLGGAAAGSVLSGGLGNLIRVCRTADMVMWRTRGCSPGPIGKLRLTISPTRWAATRSMRSAARPAWTVTISWKI